MDLKLKRLHYDKDGIFSELVKIDGEVVARTLEHSYDCKPKIPHGTYKCIRGEHKLHNKVPFITFEVIGVEGHSGILFHVGNFNADSEGCILVGEAITNSRNGKMVTNSRVAFQHFMDLQKKVNEFTLIVEDI